MKHFIAILATLITAIAFVACNNYETYGDKKEKERKAINKFIADSAFVVISESQFHAQGDVTDVNKKEFVYLDNSGVYMQIVSKGCGTPMQNGETADLLIRFMEMCLLDSTVLYNDTSPYDVDIMNVRRQGTTYSASFTQGLMLASYSNATVAAGLLIPLNYVNVGRPRTAEDRISKVRLIVPHSQGHQIATSYVYPYYYEISYERKIDL
jgi:hypothetical protein